MANHPNPVAEPPDLWSTLARQAENDRKFLYWSFGLAALFHMILFLIHFSGWEPREIKPPERTPGFVVQPVRIKEPPLQQEVIQPPVKKLPIPDPTPDEVEPIRSVAEIRSELDIPIDDMLLEIPEEPPAAGANPTLVVGGDVLPPEKIYAPLPPYTESARKARISGTVIVQAIVDQEGKVTHVKLLKGLGFGLDESAMAAIKQWKFKPATVKGAPVQVAYSLTVRFELQ